MPEYLPSLSSSFFPHIFYPKHFYSFYLGANLYNNLILSANIEIICESNDDILISQLVLIIQCIRKIHFILHSVDSVMPKDRGDCGTHTRNNACTFQFLNLQN